MIRRSAIARFIMKIFVTDCRIFLSNSITQITRTLPKIPTSPIWQNRTERPISVSVVAGSPMFSDVPFIVDAAEQFPDGFEHELFP